MSERPKLDWQVPTTEWDRYRSWHEDAPARVPASLGLSVENAMLAWIDADGYEQVEHLVDRLVEAAGRTPERLAENKTTSELTAAESNEKTRVSVRVESDAREEFAGYVRSETSYHLGEALALALREHREGGRAARLERKLERIADDASTLLEDVGADEDVRSKPTVERRTMAIASQLDEQFTGDELDRAIGEVAGTSDPTLRRYRERVLDHLDYAEHPQTEDLYLPAETAEEYRDDEGAALPTEKRAFDDLTRVEKVESIQAELIRQAVERGVTGHAMRLESGGAGVRGLLGPTPTDRTLRSLMDAAAADAGFRTDTKGGTKRVLVDLEAVRKESLFGLAGVGEAPLFAHAEDAAVDGSVAMSGGGAGD